MIEMTKDSISATINLVSLRFPLSVADHNLTRVKALCMIRFLAVHGNLASEMEYKDDLGSK